MSSFPSMVCKSLALVAGVQAIGLRGTKNSKPDSNNNGNTPLLRNEDMQNDEIQNLLAQGQGSEMQNSSYSLSGPAQKEEQKETDKPVQKDMSEDYDKKLEMMKKIVLREMRTTSVADLSDEIQRYGKEIKALTEKERGGPRHNYLKECCHFLKLEKDKLEERLELMDSSFEDSEGNSFQKSNEEKDTIDLIAERLLYLGFR